MKILHTADWHIGKKLQKHDLFADFDLFIQWLCKTIKKEAVDLLLISGDVFDLANPSSEARSQYYRSLMALRKLDISIILTGGNHDSPAMLDAPKEILRELDMHVVGGLPESLQELLIPVADKHGKTEMLVAAVPFLRDADLRSAGEGLTHDDRIAAIRKGIQNIYESIENHCKKQYPEIPVLAMGHLFAAGIETSESERDIQIGNQAAFEASQFGEYFKYIALGHIHKPQQVRALVPAFYSGSPLPLSFSERSDRKRILIIDSSESWEPRSIAIPAFRHLLKISGNIDQLKHKLGILENDSELDSLIEVELTEEKYDANKIYQLDELVTNFHQPGFEIVKHRASFREKLGGTTELYDETQQLEDLKPREVFLELIGQHEYDEDLHREILSAFDEILEEVQNDQNAG